MRTISLRNCRRQLLAVSVLCVPLLAGDRGEGEETDDEGRTKEGGLPRAVSQVTLSVYKPVFCGGSLYLLGPRVLVFLEVTGRTEENVGFLGRLLVNLGFYGH